MAAIDATFSSHTVLTLMHIIPAMIFVVLAARILLRRAGGERLYRLFFAFGAMTGATAYAMSYHAIGGWVERSAVLVFNTWFLLSLGRAYVLGLRGEAARKREWVTRAVGILLGIATTRPVMGVFFATSGRTHLGPNQFFGMAFWIGFSINAVVTEVWLHSSEGQNSTNRDCTLGSLYLREANMILTCGPDLFHLPTCRVGTDKRAVCRIVVFGR
jgi:hypothetical protein